MILNKWFNEYRWCYNRTINQLEHEYNTTGKSSSYMRGRKDWTAIFRAEADWLTLPPHTMYGAMMDACKDYQSMIAKRKRGEKCNIPRCRKRTQTTFYQLGNCIKSDGIYTRTLGKMKSAEPLPHQPSDCRILKECNRWYLLVPLVVQPRKADNQSEVRVCAIDPGVRTFATVFSLDGIHKIGDGHFGRIVRLCYYLDDLQSRWTKVGCKQRKRMRQAASRMRRKIKRLVHDAHYQTLGWLFRNYDVIIIPECSFGSAVRRATRKIRSKTVRSLLTWSFAKFRDRAIHKAQKDGKQVLIVNESYTSKTANWTGEIVPNLGGRRSIVSQDIRFDRDVNGSLGIYLKALVDHPALNNAAIINKS